MQFQQLPSLQPADSVVVVDDAAPNHGFRVIWNAGEEIEIGYNVNDGGEPPGCPFLISFLCIVSPNHEPGNISDTPPHGSIRVSLAELVGVPLAACAPNVQYDVGDEVSFAGLDYRCRQAHTSQIGWEPPQVYALWSRINAGDAWAPQVL